MKHTPEPWAQHIHWPLSVVPAAHAERPKGGAADDRIDKERYAQEICDLEFCRRHRTEHEVFSSAARIVATVNFCAGFDTAALEGVTLAEVVEAVKALLDNACEHPADLDGAGTNAVTKARALLSRLTPQDSSEGETP